MNDDLTEREKEILGEMMEDYCDQGPRGEGWKSHELEKAISKAKSILGIEL
jgi:hypothetical protein